MHKLLSDGISNWNISWTSQKKKHLNYINLMNIKIKCRKKPSREFSNLSRGRGGRCRILSKNTFTTQGNRVHSNRNLIAFTIYRLIWNQTDFFWPKNQSRINAKIAKSIGNGKYNLISVWQNSILSPFNWKETKVQ